MAVILSLSEIYSPVDNLPVWSAGGGDGGWGGDLRHWHKPQPRWSRSRGRGWRLVIVIVILFWNGNYFWQVLHCTPTTGSPIYMLIYFSTSVWFPAVNVHLYICTIPYNVKLSPKEKFADNLATDIDLTWDSFLSPSLWLIPKGGVRVIHVVDPCKPK